MAIKHVLRKLVNLLFDENNEDGPVEIRNSPVSMGYGTKSSNGRIGESSSGLNLTIYSAFGGKVVQFNTYDPTRDRMTGGLYIVTDQDNLGEELGQIITREQLAR